MVRKDLAGKTFGNLVAIEAIGVDKHHRVMWKCKCSCGSSPVVPSSNLLANKTKSCGCTKDRTGNPTHGLFKSNKRLHKIWCQMRQRCLNPKDKGYADYGARGISICKGWDDFKAFYNWATNNGYAKGLTIERKDNNGSYSPENCTWIPPGMQRRNNRRTISITYQGKTQILSDWVEEFGMKYTTAYCRLQRGLPLDKVFAN